MIGQYTLYEWILYFYIYCFCGWVFESVYVSLRKKYWVNRGFLKGPFLPIYGGGAVMMLFVSEPFKENLVLTYFAGVAGATLLELFTGVAIEAIFKVRYWDYSNQKFNYKGYICLSSSIAWGFFTIGMNEILHPEVVKIVGMVPDILLDIIMAIVSCAFLVDIVISVKEALDLRDMLIRMEEVRKEMLLLRRRVDVVIACVDDSWKEFVETHPSVERVEEIYKGVEMRFNKLKKNLPSLDKMPEIQKKELYELKNRFKLTKEKGENWQNQSGKLFKGRILGNPTMMSSKYKLSLDSLKELLKDGE